MPKKGKKAGKKGKKGGKKSRTASKDKKSAADDTPKLSTRLQPSEQYDELLTLLTTHRVTEKEVHNIRVSTRALERFTAQEIRDLRYVFDLFDFNNDGFLTANQLRKALRVLGFKLTLEQVQQHISDSSVENTAEASFNCFLDVVIDQQKDAVDYFDELVFGFSQLDLDKQGRVTFENLKKVCGDINFNIPDQELKEMMNAADTNGDGLIDQGEFINMMKKTHLFLP